MAPLHEYVVVGGFKDESAVEILRLDSNAATLQPVAAVTTGGIAPAFIAWQESGTATHKDERRLFVSNHARGRPGTGLTALSLKLHDGAKTGSLPNLALPPSMDSPLLTAASSGFTSIPDPAHAVVAPSGRWVLTAAYDDGSVSVVPVNDDDRRGSCLGAAAVLPTEAVGKAPHQVSAMKLRHIAAISGCSA
jgi:hypothetical protein